MVNVTYDASKSIVVGSGDQTFVYSPGDIAWVLTSAALVWIMIPGVCLIYSGIMRRKNALSMLFLGWLTFSVVTLQWVCIGYSLTFSEGGGMFYGDAKYFGLKGVLEKPAITNPKIPALVLCIYQLMFATFTPMLAIGAVAERVRFGPLIFFLVAWSTLVWDPVARWTWNPRGWANKLGILDFAGGTPVHITSGCAALSISFFLGPRINTHRYPPTNLSFVYIGTALVWFGWMGFNGGSALSANLRAAQAVLVSNVAASTGGLTYMLIDYLRSPNRAHSRPWSAMGFSTGAVVGLVAITPAAGYVGTPAAILFGVIASIVCHYSTWLVRRLRIDDVLEIFTVHAVGGIVGTLLTGIFAQASVTDFDGITVIPGGWLDRHFIQLGYQAAGAVAGFSWSLVVTYLILWFMELTVFLSPCTVDNAQRVGLDRYEMNEDVYNCLNEPLEGSTDDLTMREIGHHMNGHVEAHRDGHHVEPPIHMGPMGP